MNDDEKRKAEGQEEWYAEAYKMDLERLPEFIRRMLISKPDQDEGILHALVAGALATVVAMSKAYGKPMDEANAEKLMYRFIARWRGINGPIRLLRFEHMLYPMLKANFASNISSDTWGWLQEAAARKLLKAKNPKAEWRWHWQKIAQEKEVPFGWKVEG
jgi:hypothetical protein